MTTFKTVRWSTYLFELFVVFLGVTLAFALDEWNENRRKRNIEIKTLTEIRDGLQLDQTDIQDNMSGHRRGLKACAVFRTYLRSPQPVPDSLPFYFSYLTRDFIAIQNSAAYESLKTRGLDIITNDSLRLEIVALYDFHFEIIEKLEEHYAEMQFYTLYFHPINDLMVDYLVFDERGRLTDLLPTVHLTPTDHRKLLSYLWRIEYNRRFTLIQYETLVQKLEQLMVHVTEEIERLQ
ncbi:hypothetical protein SAMN05421823_109186 [Catalinimonas alkaloidigena]|uniref:Uncharacterized protein n=1 Tax=Catalinimonas alkaloidigena TaxID=1075417 RepID=A0A1G9PG50_9BACT|nr:hypothetical protein [Catalinimonas alkaloidigena]SDL97822.1 hypothetical protein SAMN05421823_109186 [Catalinimonas alkaloidigena]